MGFLRVDVDRLNRKGSVFIAELDGGRLVIGRVQGTSRVAALLAVAANWIEKDRLPSIKLVKFKRVRDMYKSEALLHSYLADYIDDSGDYYRVEDKVLTMYWKEI